MRVRLLALIALFVAGAWVQGRALPPREGGAEWLQLNFAALLRPERRLPTRATFLENPTRQQSGQPPLTYAVAALALPTAPYDRAQLAVEIERYSNNWFAPPNKYNRRDNNNVFYPGNPALTPTIVAANRGARWVAPLWGVIAVLACYGAAWEVFRDRRWALATTAFFAFTPTMLHVNSFLTTDGGATALATVAFWLAVVIARRGPTVRRSVLAGVVLGLCGLAKVSALLIAPAVGVAILLHTWKHPRRLFIHGALVAVPLLMIFGPWVLFGWLTFRDPFGTQTHRLPGHFHNPPLPPAEVLARLPEVYWSYWGKFASAVYLHPVTYVTLTALLMVAAVGYVRHGPRIDGVRWVLLATIVPVFGGLYYWIATVNFITGRLAYPAHAALTILVAGGIYRLTGGRAFGRVLLAGPVMVVGLVFAPAIIRAAYAPPPLPPPALAGPSFIFDETIRVLGHAPEDATLVLGEMQDVVLCWEVLQPTARPAAYALRYVKEGVPVAERTSVHGLGHRPWYTWQPGDTFCEQVPLPDGEVEPGARYDLLLIMLDAQTGAVDWGATAEDGTPVQFPILGRASAAQ